MPVIKADDNFNPEPDICTGQQNIIEPMSRDGQETAAFLRLSACSLLGNDADSKKCTTPDVNPES